MEGPLTLSLAPGDGTSFGQRVFERVMKGKVWEEVLLDEGSLHPRTVSSKEREEETQTQRRSHRKGLRGGPPG